MPKNDNDFKNQRGAPVFLILSHEKFILWEGVFTKMENIKIENRLKDQAKIECLCALISSLSLTERNLTLSALDYQSMGLSKKHQIEAAIDRAVDVGKILDDLIGLLRKIDFTPRTDKSEDTSG
jgi:hypothetical protein